MTEIESGKEIMNTAYVTRTKLYRLIVEMKDILCLT